MVCSVTRAIRASPRERLGRAGFSFTVSRELSPLQAVSPTLAVSRRRKRERRRSGRWRQSGAVLCSALSRRMTRGGKLFYHWTNVGPRQEHPPSVFSRERRQLEQPS